MANTFKVITRDVAPATAGVPETLYTVQSGSTIIVLGLTLANVHTAQVTGTVQLVSTTTQTSQTQNTTAHIVKDIPVPVGSSVEIMAGNKIVLNVGDIVKIDSSSVADDEFARFTANGLESRSASEVLSDIGATSATDAANEATALAIALG